MTPLPLDALDGPLLLASASPRRRELLGLLGIPFEVAPPGGVEAEATGPASEQALARAREKARAVARAHPGRTVLGADTVVVLGGEVLGKPGSEEEAASMLRRLSGRAHEVVTAVALRLPGGDEVTHVETTRVRFRELKSEEIAWYVGTGEPMDKAGAYGIQGAAAIFVRGIEGCYFNVVGLPLHAVYRLLLGAGPHRARDRSGNA